MNPINENKYFDLVNCFQVAVGLNLVVQTPKLLQSKEELERTLLEEVITSQSFDKEAYYRLERTEKKKK